MSDRVVVDDDRDSIVAAWAWAALRCSGDTAAIDAALADLADRQLQQLSVIAGRRWQLHTLAADDFDGDLAWAEGETGIHVGLGLLRRLDAACLRFATTLLANHLRQHQTLGPALPLPLLVGARQFPSAALSLYRGRMLPRSVDPAGRALGDYAAVTAALNALGPAGPTSVASLRAAHGWLSTPIGLTLAATDVDAGETAANAMALLQGEPFPHLLLLYRRLLHDALSLVLAHEAGHIELGHTRTRPGDAATSRADEVAADGRALHLLSALPAFDLRSGALLFVFLGQGDAQQAATARLSHPFAADRLALLAAALDDSHGPAMREDLNVALQLARRPLALESGDGAIDAGTAWVATDLEQTLHLTLALDPSPDPKSAPAIPPQRLEVDFCLHDRVHPDQVLRQGCLQLDIDDDSPRTLPLPPTWWLDIGNAALRAEAVRLLPLTAGATLQAGPRVLPTGSSAPLGDAQLLALAIARCADNPALALRAAHRCIDAQDEATTGALLDAVHQRLQDGDLAALRWRAEWRLRRGDDEGAAALLEAQLSQADFVPAGHRGLLAQALWARCRALPLERHLLVTLRRSAVATQLFDRALDLAMREQALALTGADKTAAEQLIGAMLHDKPFTPLTQALLGCFAAMRDAGQIAGKPDPRPLRDAAAALAAELDHADASLAYPRQILGEILFAAGLRDRDFAAAVDAFDAVLLRDPSFLPALSEQAKVAMEQGDLPATRTWLQRADRFSPAHPFLKYVRDEHLRRVEARVAPLREQALADTDAGQHHAALAACDEWARLEPDSGDAQHLRAVLLQAAGDSTAARLAELQAVALGGEDFDRMALLGQLCVECGLHDEARDTLSLAIGAASHLPLAEDCAGRSLTLLPYTSRKGVAFARSVRARAWAALGDWPRAWADAQAARADFGNGGVVRLNLAELHHFAGDSAAAASDAQAALTTDEFSLSGVQVARARVLAGPPPP